MKASNSQPVAKSNFHSNSTLPPRSPSRPESPRCCGLYLGLSQPSLREWNRPNGNTSFSIFKIVLPSKLDKHREGKGPAVVRLPRLWRNLPQLHLTPQQTCTSHLVTYSQAYDYSSKVISKHASFRQFPMASGQSASIHVSETPSPSRHPLRAWPPEASIWDAGTLWAAEGVIFPCNPSLG